MVFVVLALRSRGDREAVQGLVGQRPNVARIVGVWPLYEHQEL